MMVRRAFSTVQRRQKRRYGSVIAGALGLLLVAIVVAAYQYAQLQRTRGLAEQIFYNMKAIELLWKRSVELDILKTVPPVTDTIWKPALVN